MRFNVMLCSIATLIFSAFLSIVPTYAVEVGVDVPPNPTNISFDDRLFSVVGSTAFDGSSYYASYIASNYEPTYYGSFINKNGVNKLMRTYAYVPTSNSNYLWQLFTVNYLNSSSFSTVAWGSVRDSNYQYQSTITIDGVTYVVMSTNVLLPNNVDFSVLEYFNDSVQLIEGEWSDYTDSQIFELCKNFDHPAIIGEYDSSIPCLVRADVSFSNVPTSDDDVLAGHVVGIISPFTNQGALTSDYYIDYQCFFGYITCKTVPFVAELDTKLYSSIKYNGGVDMSLFNSDVLNWTETTYNPFRSGSGSVKVSCNTISLNMRLRRKSDGNYGDWYTVGINNLGYNESSYSIRGGNYNPVSTGYSGIVSGSVQTIVPTADFDDLLTSQNNPSTTISANGTNLGTSEGGGVLQQGGILDLITSTGETNYDNILSYLGDVPKLMGVVFGFLPPFFISFITTAFLLLVTVGLVKMLI